MQCVVYAVFRALETSRMCGSSHAGHIRRGRPSMHFCAFTLRRSKNNAMRGLWVGSSGQQVDSSTLSAPKPSCLRHLEPKPHNRKPSKHEATYGLEFLLRLLQAIDPGKIYLVEVACPFGIFLRRRALCGSCWTSLLKRCVHVFGEYLQFQALMWELLEKFVKMMRPPFRRMLAGSG